jgi:hypothetical protein
MKNYRPIVLWNTRRTNALLMVICNHCRFWDLCSSQSRCGVSL